ncbi:PEP-CTERM sorting domain-containing protein [Roseateles saccharophilus]|nr:PEP-CTERM sorting domain-containing protein [Roseateles saccharophilus]
MRVFDGADIASHACSYDAGVQIEDPGARRRAGAVRTPCALTPRCRPVSCAAPAASKLLAKAAERGENLGSITAALLRLLDRYEASALRAASSAPKLLNNVGRCSVQHDHELLAVQSRPRTRAEMDFAGLTTYSVSLAGKLAANDQGSAYDSWQLVTDLGNGEIGKSGYLFGNGPYAQTKGYVGDPFGTYRQTVFLQTGSATLLQISLKGFAVGQYYIGSGTPYASFGLDHSLYWSGIDSVSINGTPQAGYTVSSESGGNYAQSFVPTGAAVPEPATWALSLVGLCALIVGVGRSRHADVPEK